MKILMKANMKTMKRVSQFVAQLQKILKQIKTIMETKYYNKILALFMQ